MASQAPIQEPAARPAPPIPEAGYWPTPPPRPAQPIPPVAWPTGYAPRPIPSTVPSAGQRLALAIVSLGMLIPLMGIAMSVAGTLAAYAPFGLAVATQLIGVLVVGAAVVGVNVAFNLDLLWRPR